MLTSASAAVIQTMGLSLLLFYALALQSAAGQTTTTAAPPPPATTTTTTTTTATTTTTTTTTTSTTPSTTLSPSDCELFSPQLCSLSSPTSILAQISHTHDEFSCQTECQKLSSCSHFSWLAHQDNSTQCFLFRDCPSMTDCSDCTTVLSGPSRPNYGDACCSVFSRSICGLEDSSLQSVQVNVRTPGRCQELCQQEADCHHFSHDIDTCFLFASCSTYEECDSCISGPTTPNMKICQDVRAENYILIIGGTTTSGLLADSEVLTPWNTCPSPLPDVPVATKGWSADYLAGGLLICGGQDLDSIVAPADSRINRRCWTLSSMLADTWEETFSLNLRRTFHATASTHSQVWALGGESFDSLGKYRQLDSIESFTWSGGWVRNPDHKLTSPRSAACAVALDNENILFLGGFTSQQGNVSRPVLNSLESFNTVDGTWLSLAPMLEPRYHAACTTFTFEGKRGVVVSGGMGLEDKGPCGSVEFYDVAEDKWELMPPLASPRCGHTMSHLDGFLTVLGGHHNGTSITRVEEFTGGSWEETSINIGGEGRHYFGAVDISSELAQTFVMNSCMGP